jgi:hypothetical protein
MRIASALLLLLPVIPLAIAEDEATPDSYLCIPDMATGFKYKNDKWQATHFGVGDDKYILRRPKETDSFPDAAWVWGEFGDKRFYTRCMEDVSAYGFVFCTGIGQELRINVNTLRYQLYYYVGYVAATINDSPGNTPFIEIGKCSAL